MRELSQFLVYLAGVTCLLIGIAAGASLLLAEYRSKTAGQEASAKTIREPQLAAAPADSPTRVPVWIAPTAKYDYVPPPTTTRHEPKHDVVPPRATKKVAKKSVRSARDRTVASRVNDPARRAYGSAEPSRPFELFMPLQHQSPGW